MSLKQAKVYQTVKGVSCVYAFSLSSVENLVLRSDMEPSLLSHIEGSNQGIDLARSHTIFSAITLCTHFGTLPLPLFFTGLQEPSLNVKNVE